MQLLISTLCDSAADYDGKMVVMGTFDTMMAREFPAPLRGCRLALRVSASREEAGKHQLRIRILDREDKEVLPAVESDMEVRFSEKNQGLPFLSRNIIIPIGVQLPASGLYRFEIAIDGEVKSVLSFAAIEVRSAPESQEEQASA